MAQLYVAFNFGLETEESDPRLQHGLRNLLVFLKDVEHI